MTDATTQPRASAVRFVTRGRRRALAIIGGVSFLGGMTEALFLVVATRTAFAITGKNERVGIAAGRYCTVGQALGIALVLVFVRVGLGVYASRRSARLVTDAAADVRRRVASAFLHSTWPTQQGERAGSLQEVLTTYTGQVSNVINGVSQAALSGANLAAMLVLAIAVDPVGAVVLVVSVAVLASLLRPLRASVRRRAKESTRASMQFATAVAEVANLGMELHVFHVQDQATSRIDRYIENFRRKSLYLNLRSGLATPLYTGLAYLALLAALAVVHASNSATLTSLGAVMLVMLRSLSYGQASQNAYAQIASSSPAVAALQERLDYFTAGRASRDGSATGTISNLEFENVTFSYVPGHQVLKGLSFAVAPRELLGIVGPSGGGKSTLVQLLLGLRPPDSGRILIDGRELHELDRRQLTDRVTFVPQTPRMITGTVAENIRFLRDDVSGEAIEHAARLAHIHDEIVAHPDGYEREVGGAGGQLSGGQQQRICIARALVGQPDVLILDEPTSALDVRSEHLVRATLIELRKRMTVIVIAHRLSTVELCDRIMVIQQGELKGLDTPSELEATNDFYREALVLSGMRN